VDIDYVIAWVDGNDPKHRMLRRQFPPDGKECRADEAAGDVRFHENGEIYYNIASVLKYAPFIRRIIVVTDNQKPKHLDAFFAEGLCGRDFIRLVSHDEIFNGLPAPRPNFNSLAIEAALWRIPGLSEHFVYANDDFFLNAPLSPEAFFIGCRPVIGGQWAKPERKRLKVRVRNALRKLTGRGPATRPSYRKALDLGAALAGVCDGYLVHEHHPHPLRRSTFEQFFSGDMDALNRQVSYRYRHADQFNPVSLANHLEISRHGVPIGPRKHVAYLTPDMGRRIPPQLERIRSGSVPFGCIQSFEAFPAGVAGQMHRILTEKFYDTLPRELTLGARGVPSMAA